MSSSILSDEKISYISGRVKDDNGFGLEKHHVFFGNPNRKLSEKYGLWVWLTKNEHTGTKGVHNNTVLDKRLKRAAQLEFEIRHGHDRFMAVFGKNYR